MLHVTVKVLLKYSISFFGRSKPKTFCVCVCLSDRLFFSLNPKLIINHRINFRIDRACQTFHVNANVNEWLKNDNQSLNIIVQLNEFWFVKHTQMSAWHIFLGDTSHMPANVITPQVAFSSPSWQFIAMESIHCYFYSFQLQIEHAPTE